MKNVFVIFLFLNLGIFLNAQEIDNPRFQLLSTEVSETLQLQSSPVETTDIYLTIFTAGDKSMVQERINKHLTIHRGKATHAIDVSHLPAGAYYVEIIQNKKEKVFRKKFNKN